MTHTYTVELRFTGDLLEPNVISDRMSLQPTNSFFQSQNRSLAKKRRPFWAYNGKGVSGFKPEWDNLENALGFLLRSLASKKDQILDLSYQFDAIWWCGHYQTSFDGGPVLSSILLNELARYGIPLGIDNFFSEK